MFSILQGCLSNWNMICWCSNSKLVLNTAWLEYMLHACTVPKTMGSKREAIETWTNLGLARKQIWGCHFRQKSWKVRNFLPTVATKTSCLSPSLTVNNRYSAWEQEYREFDIVMLLTLYQVCLPSKKRKDISDMQCSYSIISKFWPLFPNL